MDFLAGEILLIDKPYRWTSFDVVKKVRYAIKKHLKVKKIKVGHAGTLDPLATGLLIICTGKKTKSIQELMGMEKKYSGTIALGGSTPSFDLETEISQVYPTDHIDADMMLKATQALTGEILQTPPIFSAKKIDGKRAYDLARKGEEVKMNRQLVEVTQFDIETKDFPNIDFEITCSKGTYIRSLAHDFGQLCDSGAHLTALRREAIGEFKVQDAFTVEGFLDSLKA